MNQVVPPFEHLEALAQHAFRYCSEIPEKDAGGTQWNGMGFTLSGYLFVVALNDISKVLPVPTITPLPGVKPWAKGIANVQSRLLPVVDLAEFLGSENSEYSPVPENRRIITIERREISVALIVDDVRGVMHLSGDHYQEAFPESLPERLRPFVCGTYGQDNQYVVFGVEQLINNQLFLTATLD